MENRTVTIITIGIASLFLVFGYLSNATIDSGRAIDTVESSNLQGIIGIILLLMLVVSIFFIVGNIQVMLSKNFHKKQ